MRGKTDASTTRSPCVPCTLKSLDSTPPCSLRADRARARRVMAPRVVRARIRRCASGDCVASPGSSSFASPRRFSSPAICAHELHAFDDRVEVLLAAVVAFVEVAEVDDRRVARVGGSQRHLAGRVVRVPLEHDPREAVRVLRDERRVAGKVALEVADQRVAEQIRLRLFGRGPGDDRQHGAVGRDRRRRDRSSTPGTAASSLRERRASQRLPRVEGHAVDDRDLVAILQVLADAGEIDAHRDAVRLERPRAGRCPTASAAAAC